MPVYYTLNALTRTGPQSAYIDCDTSAGFLCLAIPVGLDVKRGEQADQRDNVDLRKCRRGCLCGVGMAALDKELRQYSKQTNEELRAETMSTQDGRPPIIKTITRQQLQISAKAAYLAYLHAREVGLEWQQQRV